MKLFELFGEDIEGDEIPDETRRTQNVEKIQRREREGTNRIRAKTIANRARFKAKSTVQPENTDTPAQASLGGHGSAFLYR